jgi:hypothetical protein
VLQKDTHSLQQNILELQKETHKLQKETHCTFQKIERTLAKISANNIANAKMYGYEVTYDVTEEESELL